MISVVFGLPGSGKTTFASKLKADLWLDDITVIAKGYTLEGFLLKSGAFDFDKNKQIIISDPMLCLKDKQELLESTFRGRGYKGSFVWYYLDAPKDVCAKRCIHDAAGMIAYLSPRIHLPSWINVVNTA